METFQASGIATRNDSVRDVDAALTDQGVNLIGATIAFRPATNDLFVRLPVERMPTFALANPALTYGVDLTVGGTSCQVRIAKTGPLSASFGLFRQSAGAWMHVANLCGGDGTTRQEVVAALPLKDIGAAHGGRITRAVAFTGLGDSLTSPHTIVDRLALTGAVR